MSAGRTLRVFTYDGNPNGHMLAPSRGYLCVDYATPPGVWQSQAQGKTHWTKLGSGEGWIKVVVPLTETNWDSNGAASYTYSTPAGVATITRTTSNAEATAFLTTKAHILATMVQAVAWTTSVSTPTTRRTVLTWGGEYGGYATTTGPYLSSFQIYRTSNTTTDPENIHLTYETRPPTLWAYPTSPHGIAAHYAATTYGPTFLPFGAAPFYFGYKDGLVRPTSIGGGFPVEHPSTPETNKVRIYLGAANGENFCAINSLVVYYQLAPFSATAVAPPS